MDEKMEIRLVNPTEDGFLQKIDWNKAELEENVRSIVAAYQGLVYTEDTVSDAKNDRAALRKLLNEIEDRRKLVKKKCMEPYEVFESDLKDVTALIKEQISIIDGQVKEYENSVKEEKKARLQDVYTEAIGELAEVLPFERVFEAQYLNVSFKESKAATEIQEKIQRVKSDLAAIDALDSKYKLNAKDVYVRTLDMSQKVVAVKGDVTKAYPSVTVPIVMEMLRRDIGKNKVLLWFLGALMSNYPGNHLCIGGYLPAWLFNYVMSYVLRFLYEQAQIRRGKRNRLVYAIVCYADDFSIYGDVSKLKKAMKKATTWAYDKFGLKIKDIWQFYQIASFEEERENHKARKNGSKKRTPGVDMMGYVVRRKYTTIRGRVFRRIRRQVLRAWMDYKTMGFVPWWRACRIAAYKGWVKYSNSLKFRMEYCFDELFKMCSYSASKHGKEVENEKRILLITALSG